MGGRSTLRCRSCGYTVHDIPDRRCRTPKWHKEPTVDVPEDIRRDYSENRRVLVGVSLSGKEAARLSILAYAGGRTMGAHAAQIIRAYLKRPENLR